MWVWSEKEQTKTNWTINRISSVVRILRGPDEGVEIFDLNIGLYPKLPGVEPFIQIKIIWWDTMHFVIFIQMYSLLYVFSRLSDRFLIVVEDRFLSLPNMSKTPLLNNFPNMSPKTFQRPTPHLPQTSQTYPTHLKKPPYNFLQAPSRFEKRWETRKRDPALISCLNDPWPSGSGSWCFSTRVSDSANTYSRVNFTGLESWIQAEVWRNAIFYALKTIGSRGNSFCSNFDPHV